MATINELNSLTLTELGAIAKEIALPRWSKMRKEELVRVLATKSRGKAAGEIINSMLSSHLTGAVSSTGTASTGTASTGTTSQKKASVSESHPGDKKTKTVPNTNVENPKPASVPKPAGESKPAVKEQETPQVTGIAAVLPNYVGKQGLRRDISTRSEDGKPDRLVLMVRDPYWLHAFWEVGSKTVERAKVALGHLWFASIPVIRLFRLSSDGTGAPKRQLIRDVPIHGGVTNWYLDVANPPSTFITELGYLTRERKFHPILSSNIVETPQQQVIDELEQLDANWKGVADDLGRVFKLSNTTESGGQELKDVIEEHLGRPISHQLLSRQRVAKQGGADRTRRNFRFSADVDVIIHGKTDPNVQVNIRNEPVIVNSDGTFAVRFALPEKRHLFPIEAEGSDGVEMQRIILTLERNTRVLETVIQEPGDED